MATCLFAGSFDPFTVGHASIVRRALPLFDHVIIGVGVNGDKACQRSAMERVRNISAIYAGNDAVRVMQYGGLTADFAKSVGADCIIKGVRSVKDFEYEREQADINRMLTGVETLLFFAEPQYATVSSNMVRELQHFGADVSKLICTPENCHNAAAAPHDSSTQTGMSAGATRQDASAGNGVGKEAGR